MAELTFYINHRLTFWELFRPRVIRKPFPECWDDLKPKQVPIVCKYIKHTGINDADALRMVQELTGIPWLTLCDLPKNEQYDLLMMSRYLVEKISITKQILPVIKYKGKAYYGPEELLYNCETLEYATADGHYRTYTNAMDRLKKPADKKHPELTPEERQKIMNEAEDAVCGLVATLYRPQKMFWPVLRFFSEDRRQRFKIAKIDKMAAKMKALPSEYKEAVLTIFEGWLRNFPGLYPNLYNQRSGETETNWVSIIFECAKSPAFGTHHNVKREYIHDILNFAETNEIKRQRDEEAIKEARQKK